MVSFLPLLTKEALACVITPESLHYLKGKLSTHWPGTVQSRVLLPLGHTLFRLSHRASRRGFATCAGGVFARHLLTSSACTAAVCPLALPPADQLVDRAA